VPLRKDILLLKKLPKNVDLITAGFPCQDLSPVGRTAGVDGKQFKLVWEVLRLIDQHPAEFVLFENVPFMLRLKRGRAIDAIVTALENRGFKWAYRTIDSQAFGLPQRRPRVFLLAARTQDPRTILLSDDANTEPKPKRKLRPRSFGFYWTEGNRGTGWAIESLPALKGGSALGIPSAPAMILPSGLVATPHLCDAERLQGFPEYWTAPAAREISPRYRWRLIGNAVNVRVAGWIGRRLARPKEFKRADKSGLINGSWPEAAYNVGDGRRCCSVSTSPVRYRKKALHKFIRFAPKPLSRKAANGILGRLRASSLNVDATLLDALQAHVASFDST
jgi:DNA (cytosine-5)-methyltransferase 1